MSKLTQEQRETLASELLSDGIISRQAAIQEIKELPDCQNGYSDTYDKEQIIGILEELSSAQPEPLTDLEQRIFLKAISREKEVCKKTDEEYSGILYLVGVCNEIERKVKGALWT